MGTFTWQRCLTRKTSPRWNIINSLRRSAGAQGAHISRHRPRHSTWTRSIWTTLWPCSDKWWQLRQRMKVWRPSVKPQSPAYAVSEPGQKIRTLTTGWTIYTNRPVSSSPIAVQTLSQLRWLKKKRKRRRCLRSQLVTMTTKNKPSKIKDRPQLCRMRFKTPRSVLGRSTST